MNSTMECPKCHLPLVEGETFCPVCNNKPMPGDIEDRPYVSWLEFDELSPEIKDSIVTAAHRPKPRKPDATLLLRQKRPKI